MTSSGGEEAIVRCGTTKGDIVLKLIRVSTTSHNVEPSLEEQGSVRSFVHQYSDWFVAATYHDSRPFVLLFWIAINFCFSSHNDQPTEIPTVRYNALYAMLFSIPSFLNCRNGLQTVTIKLWNSSNAIFTTIRIFSGPFQSSWSSLVYRIPKTRNYRPFPRNISRTTPNTTLPSNFIRESFRTPGADQTRGPLRCSSVVRPAACRTALIEY